MKKLKKALKVVLLNRPVLFNTLSQVCSCEFFKISQNNYPVDTGRKLNVHKTFRRRPGRILNVLCTFNLRPVSTGNCEEHLQVTPSLNLIKYLLFERVSFLFEICFGSERTILQIKYTSK